MILIQINFRSVCFITIHILMQLPTYPNLKLFRGWDLMNIVMRLFLNICSLCDSNDGFACLKNMAWLCCQVVKSPGTVDQGRRMIVSVDKLFELWCLTRSCDWIWPVLYSFLASQDYLCNKVEAAFSNMALQVLHTYSSTPWLVILEYN